MIEEARDGFEKRKEAILAKAFRGELTAKWREENGEVQTGESLLSEIEEYNNSLKKSERNNNVNPVIEEHDIPESWKWTKLANVCEKFKYGTSKKSQNEGVCPVLRMGNLQSGIIDWGNLVYTSDADEINKYDLKYNDMLFNRTNSQSWLGKLQYIKAK